METNNASKTNIVKPAVISVPLPQRLQWQTGERLHHLYEQRCDAMGFWKSRRKHAIEQPGEATSFRALDDLANQIARFLVSKGIVPGDRIGMLFDRSVYSHASVLAASKIGAAYVPLDPSFPPERIAYILQDSNARVAITVSAYSEQFEDTDIDLLCIDQHGASIRRLPAQRMREDLGAIEENPVCYVIYTSGTTGKPKGVAVRHASICSFLNAACLSYGYHESDRVYQGMTIAFDYSFEELWVPLLCGATLIPAPSGVNLVGQDLTDFLNENSVTALCCVPTLLSSMSEQPNQLRLLMVSGEACPQDLSDQWNTPNRRFLNTYGPTEATVSATWSASEPGEKVTIGVPLPGYTIAIVDPDEQRVLPYDEVGEICIAGIGLADGYLNRPEQTSRAFVNDFIGIADNPSGKLYRTGDLGKIDGDGLIVCLGRVDTQVKIRGYRIELGEIEAVARTIDGVSLVAVNPVAAEPLGVEQPGCELAVFYTCTSSAVDHDELRTQMHAAMREHLPPYMVPAYFETLDTMPVLPSGKTDRNSLPLPSSNRFMSSGQGIVEPSTDLEKTLTTAMATALKVDAVSTTAHFFNELGANSLTMARYLASIRKQTGAKRLSMKVIYQNPTIVALANAITPEQSIGAGDQESVVQTASTNSTCESQIDTAATIHRLPATTEKPQTPTPQSPPVLISTAKYITCALIQASYAILLVFTMSFAAILCYGWVQGATGLIETYFRSAASGALFFFGLAGLLIGVKWLAVGRFKEQEIKVWSLAYARFWIAKSAIQANPLNLFIGSPIYCWFLRALGAQVGKRSLVLSRPPICTDLIRIGNDTVVRQDTFYNGYIVSDGVLRTGAINIGHNAFVGEACVLEINSVVGNHAQLGTSSALLEGCTVPDGMIYQGSPASESKTNFNRVPASSVSPQRAIGYSALQILNLVVLLLPLPWLIPTLIATFDSVGVSQILTGGSLTVLLPYLLAYSAALFGATIVSAMISVLVLPRVYNRLLRPAEVHPLYGFQYYLARCVTRTSNSRLLNTLFGDSSMIVHYLSAIGYDLSESTQTGSNFGVSQRHHSPFLCKFSRNTLVSDGLMLMNMESSSSSFRMSSVNVAANNYLGNLLHVPADSQVGENCLIATKAMLPIDGPLRENVGILGSPPFEIPRSVARDHRFDYFKQPDVLQARLRMKLRSNLVTLALYLVRNWSTIFFTMLTAAGLTGAFYESVSHSLVLSSVLMSGIAIISFVFAPLYSLLFERTVLAFHPLKPLFCSLYDQDFWRHERFWKLNYNVMLQAFNGTPLKGWLLHLQGVKVGKRVFDDGASITEPTLVEIGDGCCLNNNSSVQCHSLEDGTFKSDRIRIGAHVNIGVRGFVHYGTVVGENSTIRSDSFVMKGTIIESGDVWLGNPAHESGHGANIEQLIPATIPNLAPTGLPLKNAQSHAA